MIAKTEWFEPICEVHVGDARGLLSAFEWVHELNLGPVDSAFERVHELKFVHV